MLTVGIGTLLLRLFPFPGDNAILQFVAAEKPMIFVTAKYAYETMLFSTPFILCSMLLSILHIFFVRPKEAIALAPLRPYPEIASRNRLFLVVGEIHNPGCPGRRNNSNG